MILQVDFGAAQTGVGYRFYNTAGAFVGARVTTGIASAPQPGVYIAANATIPSGAFGVYWDCDNANFTAIEALDIVRTAPAARPVNVDSNGRIDVGQVAGTNQTARDIGADTAAIKAKTDAVNANDVTVVSPVDVTGSTITVRAGDTWSIPITGLGNISGVTKLWFAVNKLGAEDADAQLFVEKTAGLVTLNGAEAEDSSLGSLTVDDASLGSITIEIDESVTDLDPQNIHWSLKKLIGGVATTLATGPFKIAKSGIKAIA